MSPSQFKALSHDDKAAMIAHDRIFAVMQGYEAHLSAQKTKEIKGKR